MMTFGTSREMPRRVKPDATAAAEAEFEVRSKLLVLCDGGVRWLEAAMRFGGVSELEEVEEEASTLLPPPLLLEPEDSSGSPDCSFWFASLSAADIAAQWIAK